MTVEPGYGGQAFMPETLEKIEKLKAEIGRRGLNIDIQVDGGINEETAVLVKKAGANNLVAGSYVFKANDRKEAIKLLK
jgi:ribulose-phosphate 3-epimerase